MTAVLDDGLECPLFTGDIAFEIIEVLSATKRRSRSMRACRSLRRASCLATRAASASDVS